MVEGMRIGILEWNFSLLETTETKNKNRCLCGYFFRRDPRQERFPGLACRRKPSLAYSSGCRWDWETFFPLGHVLSI
jgi:hypothetical protein